MHLIGNSPLRVLAIILLSRLRPARAAKGLAAMRSCSRWAACPQSSSLRLAPQTGQRPLAVLATQNHEGGLHHQGREERVGEVDGVVLRDEGELHVVVLAFNVLGLLEEVVLVHLGGDVELGVLQAAVAGALDVGAQDAAGKMPSPALVRAMSKSMPSGRVKSWPSV